MQGIFLEDSEDFRGTLMAALDMALRLRGLSELPPVFFEKALHGKDGRGEHRLLQSIIGEPIAQFEHIRDRNKHNYHTYHQLLSVFGETVYNGSIYIFVIEGQYTYGFNVIIQNAKLVIIDAGLNRPTQSEDIFTDTGYYYDQLNEHIDSFAQHYSGLHAVHVYNVTNLQEIPEDKVRQIKHRYMDIFQETQKKIQDEFTKDQ